MVTLIRFLVEIIVIFLLVAASLFFSSRLFQMTQPFYRWFGRPRVGIFLMLLLVFASVAGSFISPVEQAQDLVFYNVWYKALLALVGLSLVCTILDSLRLRRKMCSPAALEKNPQFYEHKAVRADHEARTVRATRLFGGEINTLLQAFEKLGYQCVSQGPFGFARKGEWGKWGAIFCHAGLVIILLAGFVTEWTKDEAVLQLVEGDGTNQLVRWENNMPELETANFRVYCDDFDTGFFPHTRIPSHYISRLTLVAEDKPPQPVQVEVNRTVQFAGWTFHQTDFLEGQRLRNAFPEHPLARFRLALYHQSEPDNPLLLEMSLGQERWLHAGESPELTGVEGGSPKVRAKLQGARLKLDRQAPYGWKLVGKEGLLAQGKMMQREAPQGKWSLQVEGHVTPYGTLITLTRNPALVGVWLGTGLVLIGLALAFFVRRRSFWFWLDQDQQCLHLVARFRQPRPALDGETTTALDSLCQPYEQQPTEEKEEEV